jgi:hypothetical protein
MATELQTITNRRPPAPCSLLANNAALLKLVDDVQPGIAQRVPSLADCAALSRLLPIYEAALAPASLDEIEDAVTMLSLAYPASKSSVEEAGARLDVYAAGLADVPADILNLACMAALRASKFFPSVSEIRERCTGLALRQWRLQRIKHLIALHDAQAPKPDDEGELTDEQQAKVDAWMKSHGIAAWGTIPQPTTSPTAFLARPWTDYRPRSVRPS